MGLGDKFRDLAKQAQETVGERRDEIHDAVDRVSLAADQQTKGKYTQQIAKVSRKAGEAVDKFAQSGEPPSGRGD